MKENLKNVFSSKSICYICVLTCVLILVVCCPKVSASTSYSGKIDTEDYSQEYMSKILYDDAVEDLKDLGVSYCDYFIYYYYDTDQKIYNYFICFTDKSNEDSSFYFSDIVTSGALYSSYTLKAPYCYCYKIKYSSSGSYDFSQIYYGTSSNVSFSLDFKDDGTFYSANKCILYSSCDLSNSSTVVFQKTLLVQPAQGVVAQGIQKIQLLEVLQEILGVLPVVMITLVGLLGLRKALAMLFQTLRSC